MDNTKTLLCSCGSDAVYFHVKASSDRDTENLLVHFLLHFIGSQQESASRCQLTSTSKFLYLPFFKLFVTAVHSQ